MQASPALPPYAEGPNGNPRLSRLLGHGTAVLFATAMATLALTGAANQHDGKAALGGFAGFIILVLLAGLAYLGHTATKPLPTREQLRQQLAHEIENLQTMLGALGVGDDKKLAAVAKQLSIAQRRLEVLGAGPQQLPAPATRLALTARAR